MKINLVSRAENAQDKFNRILAFILSEFKYFQVAEFSKESFSYNAYPVKPDNADTNGSRRAINSELSNFVYSPANGAATQKTYGYEYLIDRAYLEDLNVNTTPDGLKRQIENEQIRLAKRVAYDVLYDMVNGDGENQILGLANLVKDAATSAGQVSNFGLTAAQIHTSLVQIGKQLDLASESTLRSFEEDLLKVFAEMSDNAVLVMNSYMSARMTTIAKKLNSYTEVKTDFAKPIPAIANHAIVPVPISIIPQTESDGVNNDCSSIYVIDFNEADGFRYPTNSGFYFKDFDNLESKPSGKSRLEFIGNCKLEDPKKFKRLSRIRL
jgi:hypothetical protein